MFPHTVGRDPGGSGADIHVPMNDWSGGGAVGGGGWVAGGDGSNRFVVVCSKPHATVSNAAVEIVARAERILVILQTCNRTHISAHPDSATFGILEGNVSVVESSCSFLARPHYAFGR